MRGALNNGAIARPRAPLPDELALSIGFTPTASTLLCDGDNETELHLNLSARAGPAGPPVKIFSSLTRGREAANHKFLQDRKESSTGNNL
jgi:hypothetical protein